MRDLAGTRVALVVRLVRHGPVLYPERPPERSTQFYHAHTMCEEGAMMVG